MTKRRPTLMSQSERLPHGEIVRERMTDDHHWTMMRDWMARVDDRFDRIDARLDRVDDRLDRIDARLDRADDQFKRIDSRFSQIDLQIAALTVSIKELAVTVAGIDRRLCVVEAKVDDLIAWKHRIWGVVIALGALSGALTVTGSLLMRHAVG